MSEDRRELTGCGCDSTRSAVHPWLLGKTHEDYIGEQLQWLRDAPWGFGEYFCDDVTLVRITPTGRAVIEFENGYGKRARRTVYPGKLLVPVRA